MNDQELNQAVADAKAKEAKRRDRLFDAIGALDAYATLYAGSGTRRGQTIGRRAAKLRDEARKLRELIEEGAR